jgi:hypothetical protein
MNEVQFLALILAQLEEYENEGITTTRHVQVMLKDRIQEHQDAEKGMTDFTENPIGKN